MSQEMLGVIIALSTLVLITIIGVNWAKSKMARSACCLIIFLITMTLQCANREYDIFVALEKKHLAVGGKDNCTIELKIVRDYSTAISRMYFLPETIKEVPY